MPDTVDIPALQQAIEERHHVGSRHIGSVDVRAFHPGPLPWHGIVSVFRLVGHPQTATAYAWRSTLGIAVMLAIPPIATAADAVRVWLAAN